MNAFEIDYDVEPDNWEREQQRKACAGLDDEALRFELDRRAAAREERETRVYRGETDNTDAPEIETGRDNFYT